MAYQDSELKVKIKHIHSRGFFKFENKLYRRVASDLSSVVWARRWIGGLCGNAVRFDQDTVVQLSDAVFEFTGER